MIIQHTSDTLNTKNKINYQRDGAICLLMTLLMGSPARN